MWTSLRLYQLITLQLLFQFQKTKIASLLTVSLLSEHYFRKTENLIKPLTVAKVLFRISN